MKAPKLILIVSGLVYSLEEKNNGGTFSDVELKAFEPLFKSKKIKTHTVSADNGEKWLYVCKPLPLSEVLAYPKATKKQQEEAKAEAAADKAQAEDHKKAAEARQVAQEVQEKAADSLAEAQAKIKELEGKLAAK